MLLPYPPPRLRIAQLLSGVPGDLGRRTISDGLAPTFVQHSSLAPAPHTHTPPQEFGYHFWELRAFLKKSAIGQITLFSKKHIKSA